MTHFGTFSLPHSNLYIYYLFWKHQDQGSAKKTFSRCFRTILKIFFMSVDIELLRRISLHITYISIAQCSRMHKNLDQSSRETQRESFFTCYFYLFCLPFHQFSKVIVGNIISWLKINALPPLNFHLPQNVLTRFYKYIVNLATTTQFFCEKSAKSKSVF